MHFNRTRNLNKVDKYIKKYVMYFIVNFLLFINIKNITFNFF